MAESFYRKPVFLVMALLLGLVMPVLGEEFSDPMRPAREQRPATPAAEQGERQEVAWILQAVLLGEDRALAVIDGQTIGRGEDYRGARLLSVQADGVVLQRRSGKKIVLKLAPGIHKTMFADMEKRPK